jgi:hypothetical protein
MQYNELVQVRTYHRFAVCDKCVSLNTEIARAKGPQERALWKLAKHHHATEVSCVQVVWNSTALVFY